MAKPTSLTIPIEMQITQETITKCLQILEWWLNEDFDRDIYCHTVDMGDRRYRRLSVQSKSEILDRINDMELK